MDSGRSNFNQTDAGFVFRKVLVNNCFKNESSRSVVCQSVFTCFLVFHGMIKQIIQKDSQKDVVILRWSFT